VADTRRRCSVLWASSSPGETKITVIPKKKVTVIPKKKPADESAGFFLSS
jgi:hypothetical protein